MRTSIAGLWALLLLAAGLVHGHAHRHGAHRRGLQVQVITLTEIVVHTILVGDTSVLQATTSASANVVASASVNVVATSAAKVDATPPAKVDGSAHGDGNPFKLLEVIPGHASVKNSCAYPVYVRSAGNPTCENPHEDELIEPNSTFTEKIRTCKEGGISLKLSATKDIKKPMQFEYTVWADKTTVSYDISYLDCMKNKDGEQDLSDCVGHNNVGDSHGGIQARAGDDSCPDYFCHANEWCAQQAYVVAEFDYKPGAPVGACAVDKGIAFELCAGNH